MKSLKNRTIGFYIQAAIPLLCLVSLVAYLVYASALGKYDVKVILGLGIGCALSTVQFWVKTGIIELIASIIISVTLFYFVTLTETVGSYADYLNRIRCDQKEQTINAYAELVKKNIDFDVLLHTYSREQDLVEEIYQLILETVQTEKDMIRIAGEYYPAGFVKGKLLKLNYSHKEFILSVKHTAVSSLPLGSDPLGNIARINNLLESYPKKLADAEQKLETVKEQLENAKQEVVKPFPKEKELNQMMERLSELNALLNMDEQGSSEEPENSGKQSIHDKLNAIKQKGQA